MVIFYGSAQPDRASTQAAEQARCNLGSSAKESSLAGGSESAGAQLPQPVR